MSKCIDLTGLTFGRLTVLSRAENIGKRAAWLCQCDCGAQKIIRSDSLKSGQTKSCGCYAKDKARIQIKINGKNKITQDLIGKTFGKLTVLSLENENNRSYWLCQCQCGGLYKALTHELISGKRTSCGCSRQKDILNQRFGKLTVIEKTDRIGADRSIIWKCKCDCGTIVEVNGSNLRNGHTYSCGCIKSKGEEAISLLFNTYRINYLKEKVFDNCRFPDTNALARFDFYVDNTYLIEFDGEQHFKNGGWDVLTYTQNHDKYKNKWCKDNNIPLIRIPYTHLKELCIEDLLLETSKFII